MHEIDTSSEIDPATFGGFSVTAIHTMRHLETLSLRNIALNLTEAGISALLLLGTLPTETSLGISERLLYIVSCTSSAGYLWCACELNCCLLGACIVSAGAPLRTSFFCNHHFLQVKR